MLHETNLSIVNSLLVINWLTVYGCTDKGHGFLILEDTAQSDACYDSSAVSAKARGVWTLDRSKSGNTIRTQKR